MPKLLKKAAKNAKHWGQLFVLPIGPGVFGWAFLHIPLFLPLPLIGGFK